MDPTLAPGTWFESQFQICVYEHAILRIYISFFYQLVSEHILVLQILYLYYGAYSCISYTEVPVGTTEHFTCTKVPVGTTEQIQRYR